MFTGTGFMLTGPNLGDRKRGKLGRLFLFVSPKELGVYRVLTNTVFSIHEWYVPPLMNYGAMQISKQE